MTSNAVGEVKETGSTGVVGFDGVANNGFPKGVVLLVFPAGLEAGVVTRRESPFGDIRTVDEAESFGLGVELIASGDDFESVFGGGGTKVHNGNGNHGDKGENRNSKHKLDDGIAALGALVKSWVWGAGSS